MNQRDLIPILQSVKALADENRLRMIGYLGNQEHNVGELADLLGLTEPTISHHLTRLREAGMVNLRTDGNQRFYRLNESSLRRLSQQVAGLTNVDMESAVVDWDDSWIDDLDFDAADRKILHDYIQNRRLKQYPSQRKKLLVVLRWLATYFEAGVMYTEQQVNAILTQYHEDYATLRRELVDFGFLRRERGGGKYWLTPEDDAN